MNKEPQSLGYLLGKLIRQNDWGDKYICAKIENNWEKILGKNMSKALKIERFKEGALYLKSDSSTWRTEALLRKENIIRNINDKLGSEEVKTLIIR
ncbi:MAG: DUF721 domain-containing protein [Candidatus Kapaibacterium sp.]